MSGKAYTMREMKAIVDYLTERRAYGEIRGRRMWMEYADSKQTTRTWQSLKETFLKRILPDITNPYYKLTVQQIANFQHGTDLEARINNRLEIQTIHGDSSSDTDRKDLKTLNTKNTNGREDAGEDIMCSNINQNRSSTDTVVIEPCYKTAEEIRNDLESPGKERGKENPSPIPCSTKSIRDYITYSEPLTPMLQEVLHDFASEDEADEPQMQIVEYPEPVKQKDTSSQSENMESENNRVENNDDVENVANKDNTENEDSTVNKINESILNDTVDKSDDVQVIEDSEEVTEPTTNRDDGATNTAVNGVSKNEAEKVNPSTKSQNSTADTLPNNQEAFNELHKTSENSIDKQESNNLSVNKDVNDSRKRSNSKEMSPDVSPEKRICTDETRERNLTDTDTKAQDKQTTTKLDSKTSNTEGKGQVNPDENHNIQSAENPTVARDAISNKQNVSQGNKQSETINESVCISDENVSEGQVHQDVVIKSDVDKASLMSEDTEPRVTRRTLNKRSTNQSESSGNNREVMKDVVVLKSRSESTSDHIIVSPKKSKASLRAAHKMHRDRALANVFGFSSGATSNRKKQQNVKRFSTHQRAINSSSSEEWTSDTATEYIFPPRGRRNKISKKYLKPKSARILSLEEEGGLFVMYGKKIYPVVKDGKILKNYVTYSPNNDSEDEDSYWKLKYVEEKKKSDELKKLLENSKKRESVPVVSNETPVPNANICEKPAAIAEPPKEVVEKNVEPSVKLPETKAQPTETKTVKIQFMKDNETVQVEGHWSQIQPVLEQVVHILHKEPEREASKRPMEAEATSEVPVEGEATPEVPVTQAAKKPKLSRDSTPISTIQLDDDVNEKLDKIEEEIFQKIQERDLAENTNEESSDIHVTKRKVGRPKLSLSRASSSKAGSMTPGKASLRPPDEATDTRRPTRTPKKNDKESPEKVESESKRATRRSSRNNVLEDDDAVKYKFPSPSHQATNKNKPTRKTATKQTAKRKFPIKTAKIFSSPDTISTNSIESSHGYQDSDDTNISICLRKKRRVSVTVLNKGRAKNQRFSKRKPQQHEDMSSDSNLSFVTAPLKSASQQSSSLNTEVYRSDSYQLLMPQIRNSVQHLDVIEEKSPTADNIRCINNDDAASDALTEKSTLAIHESSSLSPAFVKYAESSNNVTAPLSPVLSIIEKLSVSKNELDNTKDIDMPNESHKEAKQTMLNDYMREDIDMSVPLMEQECGLQENRSNEMECNYNLNIPETSPQLSHTLLSKVGAVNISEPTLSESIHQKLKNLLLESAKKLAKQMTENNDKDKENKMEICEPEKQRKTKAKKRCSTPRKRQSKNNSKDINGELHVEEEHIESCVNEKSREPPMLIVTDVVENNNNIVATDISEGKSKRLRKKKDVIKVKISKPKTKKKEYDSDDMQGGKMLQADSGINDMESGVFFRGLEDSLDLIHNHSDTCLRAHECISDSVEIVDDNAISIISVNSDSAPKRKVKSAPLTLTTDHLSDICCENAQDSTNLCTASEIQQYNSNESCIFKSPIANVSSVTSLLTDDLSDDISIQNTGNNRLSKWYLLSEDEASNTNNIDLTSNIPKSISGYGSNLQEIFPITCAVPDLSTITEENTAKFNIDGNTGSQFDSPSFPNV